MSASDADLMVVAIDGPAGSGKSTVARCIARLIDPTRLDRLETQWAMTIHKSQGSQADEVTVLMPPEDSNASNPISAPHQLMKQIETGL